MPVFWEPFVVKNGRNKLFNCAGLMPVPLSRTTISTAVPPFSDSSISTRFSPVLDSTASRALRSRLMMTDCTMLAFIPTHSTPLFAHSSVMPWSLALCCDTSTSSLTSASRSKCSTTSLRAPKALSPRITFTVRPISFLNL